MVEDRILLRCGLWQFTLAAFPLRIVCGFDRIICGQAFCANDPIKAVNCVNRFWLDHLFLAGFFK